MWHDERQGKAMTLFWDKTGPLVYYTGGTFGVEDLNPEAKMRWKMSRWEIFKMGFRCLRAAMGLSQ
jgi:hypothetical protein